MRLVIDTNVMVESITRKSPYHKLFLSIKNGDHFLAVSNDILFEYYEIFFLIYRKQILEEIAIFFEYSQNVLFVDPHYHFNLIQADPDDNKFVDCAICSNADYLITSDRHFNSLKEISFPKIHVVSPEAFLKKI